ncbi:MAG: putative membrane protein YfcA [Bermanella sp.]|jgi:uncharacterized membrane protein YfcA
MEPIYTSLLFWLLATLGVILTGISKSGFAGGAGVVAVPILALVMPVPQAAALMLPLLIVMDIKAIHLYRKHIDKTVLLSIVPAALIGIAIGSLLLTYTPGHVLQITLGVISIMFACWQSLTPLFGKMRGAGIFWGGISGITSTLIHAGGPPINIYLIAKALPKLTWLATSAIFFGVMNIVKVIPYSLTGQWNAEILWLSLILVPVAYLGIWLGHKVQHRFSEQHFMKICRVLLFVSGVLLLTKAFLE